MENETKLKNGDSVKLKSGGPVMTINEIVEQPFFREEGDPIRLPIYVNCSWFDKSKLMSAKFHIDAVELVKQDSPE